MVPHWGLGVDSYRSDHPDHGSGSTVHHGNHTVCVFSDSVPPRGLCRPRTLLSPLYSEIWFIVAVPTVISDLQRKETAGFCKDTGDPSPVHFIQLKKGKVHPLAPPIVGEQILYDKSTTFPVFLSL